MIGGTRLDTAQCLTSSTPGAIGVIALMGPNASRWVLEHFRSVAGKTVSHWSVSIARFGHWKLDAQHAEELVVVRHSEEAFEIHCHAGMIVHAILAQLAKLGANILPLDTLATPTTQFTLEQQAEHCLQRATTETTAAVLLDQYRGALRKDLSEILHLLNHSSPLPAMEKLAQLLSHAAVGIHLVEPWQIQLAGPPNVGKSSLLNCILGFQRTIVHNSEGTTRDLVHATTALDGWPFCFTDSAGIRSDEELSEAETLGIDRALAAAQNMDLIALVLEPSGGLTASHQIFLDRFPEKVLLVLNQIDLLSPEQVLDRCGRFHAIGVSAHTRTGLPELLDHLRQRLIPHPPPPGVGVPFLPHQKHAIHTSLAWLQKGEIAASADVLHELLASGQRSLA